MSATAMTITVLGGVGLFLLGMAVMTDGLRSLAGSALRATLSKAAATPARGAVWGALLTIIVQSSSATTMTTIGLVSAGLLTFPQALGVIFGANVGTTGTGWLVALLGVKFSLNPAAMPMVFAGALLHALGRGRWAGAGGAIAGLGLLLVGLTMLQGGMADLATRMNPADFPPANEGYGGIIRLVMLGAVMTTLMQSSSAAVAVTLSALHAGAIAPDQAAAMVIGQNIGSAVSSALAALGSTVPARRTAASHIMFNITTGVLATGLFPIYAESLVRLAGSWEAPIALATFHTVFNITGVAVLLPMTGRFARVIERLIPDRGSAHTQHLDASVLRVPAVAVEAARRTVALVVRDECTVIAGVLARREGAARDIEATVRAASESLAKTRAFLAGLREPPASAGERARLESTLHALDHADRMLEHAAVEEHAAVLAGDPQGAQIAGQGVGVLEGAAMAAGLVADAARGRPADLDSIASSAASLASLRRAHRLATINAAANGQIAPDAALARTDAARTVDRLAYHAWRAAAHLSGEIAPAAAT
ncbi:MAG: hypothetical protein HBSAPP03_17380 [Phycisphaerae bacterium]|nr:MAG: hypothetical protein HBSAPP03_17380 [Phycisphaerae bacterium]